MIIKNISHHIVSCPGSRGNTGRGGMSDGHASPPTHYWPGDKIHYWHLHHPHRPVISCCINNEEKPWNTGVQDTTLNRYYEDLKAERVCLRSVPSFARCEDPGPSLPPLSQTSLSRTCHGIFAQIWANIQYCSQSALLHSNQTVISSHCWLILSSGGFVAECFT